MTAVALASRFDVIWIGGCIFALGLMALGAGLLWDKHQQAKRRAYLLKRIEQFCHPERETVIEQARKAWKLNDSDGIVPIQKGRTK